MDLTSETPRSPMATSHKLWYSYDDRRLQTFATRYTSDLPYGRRSSRKGLTLLLIGGPALSQENWVPFIQEIYRLSSISGSTKPSHIRSIWVIQPPRHGDAEALSEDTLDEHCSPLELAAAIRAFFLSDLLTAVERANLVGVCHSDGGTAMIEALGPAVGRSPLKSLVLVEMPYVGPESWPEALEAYAAESLRPDTRHIQSARPNGLHLRAKVYLDAILSHVPVHAIIGSVNDVWSDRFYRRRGENLRMNAHKFASVSIMPGVGHRVSAEAPQALASEILRVLGRDGYESIEAKL